jgi:hypothetical protein
MFFDCVLLQNGHTNDVTCKEKKKEKKGNVKNAKKEQKKVSDKKICV